MSEEWQRDLETETHITGRNQHSVYRLCPAHGFGIHGAGEDTCPSCGETGERRMAEWYTRPGRRGYLEIVTHDGLIERIVGAITPEYAGQLLAALSAAQRQPGAGEALANLTRWSPFYEV